MEEKNINYPRSYYASERDIKTYKSTFNIATMCPDEYGRYILGKIQAVRWYEND